MSETINDCPKSIYKDNRHNWKVLFIGPSRVQPHVLPHLEINYCIDCRTLFLEVDGERKEIWPNAAPPLD